VTAQQCAIRLEAQTTRKDGQANRGCSASVTAGTHPAFSRIAVISHGMSTLRNPRRPRSTTATAYRVFISHGGADAWVASQIASRLRDYGAITLLDNDDLHKGDDFKHIIRAEVGRSDELVALFTPWSTRRNWVWVEIGAAWVTEKRVVVVLYQVTMGDLDTGGGRAVLNDLNLVEINELECYFREVKTRVEGKKL
jgi:TIR domain